MRDSRVDRVVRSVGVGMVVVPTLPVRMGWRALVARLERASEEAVDNAGAAVAREELLTRMDGELVARLEDRALAGRHSSSA